MLAMRLDNGGALLYDPAVMDMFIWDRSRFAKMTPVSKPTPDILYSLGVNAVRISLGKACNNNCAYCQEKAHSDIPDFYPITADIKHVMKELRHVLQNKGEDLITLELWGGEPLLYFDTIKEIIESFHERTFAKQIKWHLTTNGLLLDEDVHAYVIKHNIEVVLSHDGPGQVNRGVDILDGPQKELISDLMKRNLLYISSVITNESISHLHILRYFQKLFPPDVLKLYEGIPLQINDISYLKYTPFRDNLLEYTDAFYDALVNHRIDQHFKLVHSLLGMALNELSLPAKPVYGAKCRSNHPSKFCIDLNGKLINCHSYTDGDFTIFGESCAYGTLADFSVGREPDRCVGFYNDPGCANCPVLFFCRGACPQNDRQLHEYDCKVKFAHHLAILKALIHSLTNRHLVQIEGDYKFSGCDRLPLQSK